MNKKSLFALILMGMFVLWLSPSSQVFSFPFSPSTFVATDYQLPGGIVDKSSPTLADLTGDGVPEILLGTTNENYANTPATYNEPTVLVVMSGNGSILWSKDVGAPINSSPAVGDINNDGQPEIVVSTGGSVFDLLNPGAVIAYDRNGTELWRFLTLDHHPLDGFGDGVYSSPTLCDVDGNGTMEVAFGGWDQRIYLLDNQGNSLWNNIPGNYQGQGHLNADSIWSTAACADLNSDGNKEIIIGADISGKKGILPDGTTVGNGGFLYIFDKDGNMLVRYFVNETIYSSPAVGDLDGDGDLEIVTGTGWFWWNHRGRSDSLFVYAFDTSQVFSDLNYADPNKLPHLSGWPKETPYPGYSSPALADLDGDNDLEIIIGTGDPFLQNDVIPGAGSVYAWHHTGQLVSGWPISPQNSGGNDASVFSSPTVADVDNDGQLEILFSMIWDVQIYNADGTFQEMLQTQWTIWGSPAIGDTDNDNQMDVWIAGGKQAAAGGDQSKGYLWNFEQSETGLGAMPWPQFHRDAMNTGLYPQPAQISAPSLLDIFHQTGNNNAATGTLTLKNTGGTALNFSAATSTQTISLSSTSGQISAGGSIDLTVSVESGGLSEGANDVGNILITDTDANSQVASISVSVTVGDIQNIYLPLTIK